ncbi:hypothetical protein [Maritalea mediterranea]|uniref:Uncharacterized protein n=1 Tax=Maritalea mediterranea TaxID=2909667 RepID=A0ABS9E5C8_9HYPH|nr:hypothetical protein [Maritalea mediterranea]MCF4098067.1 hypothetical protein [Maritalea mediterranea]
MKRFLFLSLFAAFVLAGCKADNVQIELQTSDIVDVAQGGATMVEFEAEFSNFGELDDEQRAQVSALESILENYLTLNDFELAHTETGFKVTIEGEITMTSDLNVDDAYFIGVAQSDIVRDATLVQLKTGSDFDRMQREMKAVNFMLAPDAFHPTRFRLRGEAPMDILAPAVQIDGHHYLMWQGTARDRLSLVFSGGAFEEVGAGFFIR